MIPRDTLLFAGLDLIQALGDDTSRPMTPNRSVRVDGGACLRGRAKALSPRPCHQRDWKATYLPRPSPPSSPSPPWSAPRRELSAPAHNLVHQAQVGYVRDPQGNLDLIVYSCRRCVLQIVVAAAQLALEQSAIVARSALVVARSERDR